MSSTTIPPATENGKETSAPAPAESKTATAPAVATTGEVMKKKKKNKHLQHSTQPPTTIVYEAAAQINVRPTNPKQQAQIVEVNDDDEEEEDETGDEDDDEEEEDDDEEDEDEEDEENEHEMMVHQTEYWERHLKNQYVVDKMLLKCDDIRFLDIHRLRKHFLGKKQHSVETYQSALHGLLTIIEVTKNQLMMAEQHEHDQQQKILLQQQATKTSTKK